MDKTEEPSSSLPSALYVVATPLGHLSDITLRALEILKTVDLIAAEDTRHSQRLLSAYSISTPCFALHEHNEQSASGRIIDELAQGHSVALISDAGTPSISDPGAIAVRRVREAGYRVSPVPGPSAVATVLSVAGLATASFRFVGFLPPKSAARQRALATLRHDPAALVFYESPHRIVEWAADLAEQFDAERAVVVGREMTKVHEQIVTTTVSELSVWLSADKHHSRGEFVLVVAGAPERTGLSEEALAVLNALLVHLPLKSAVDLAADVTGAARKALYARALEIKKERSLDSF